MADIGVLLDVSGVLYVGDQAAPGAAAALGRLREASVPMRLVSNVSREPASAILARVAALGLEVERDELLTAPHAARAPAGAAPEPVPAAAPRAGA